jgi:hypothetical protein
MVSRLFMRLVNAEEKSWDAAILINFSGCPFEGQALAANAT